MKIAITGGHSEAEFIISMFSKEKHDLVIINDDLDIANKISQDNGLNVYYGDPTKPHILKEGGIEGSDILISLCDEDTDNYVICCIAKNMLNVKKCICIVKNPKNVDIFKKLGLTSVISSTYLLYKTIKGESEIESIVRTLAIENERISITEIKISKGCSVIGKQIKELEMPVSINISCIFREPEIIIPDGNTMIMENDKLLIISEKSNLDKIVEFFKQKVEENDW